MHLSHLYMIKAKSIQRASKYCLFVLNLKPNEIKVVAEVHKNYGETENKRTETLTDGGWRVSLSRRQN